MRPLMLLTFCLFLILSCRQDLKENLPFKVIVSDTSITHQSENELNISKQRSVKLNLPFIYNGVDSFELRIWVNAMWTQRFLAIIRYANKKWLANKYFYYESEGTVDSVEIYNISLKDDISKMVAYLSTEEILSLPSQNAIPGFVNNLADGQTCLLEISTKTFYKALKYNCPEHFSYEANNKKFMEIMNFLDGYYNFYNPWCK